jgi:uracil-DNA glycosylase
MMTEFKVRRFLTALKGLGIDTYVFDKPDLPELSTIRRLVSACYRCPLGDTRKYTVFGEGDPLARLVFVGEAPGEEEDLQGRPFVGRAGKLLDRLIERIGLKRSEVYICNVLKCRPPHNRDPEPEETAACQGYLFKQLDIIRPKVICTLGRHAYNALFGVDESITRVRGTMTRYKGTLLLPTYHPSFLLRNEGKMKDAWTDMERLRRLLKGW